MDTINLSFVTVCVFKKNDTFTNALVIITFVDHSSKAFDAISFVA